MVRELELKGTLRIIEVCCAYCFFTCLDCSRNYFVYQNKSNALKNIFTYRDVFREREVLMNPDYTAMVNDFVRPVVSFFLFAFMILGWAVAYQLMKEVTELKIKLGRETQRERFKEWFLRKSAPLVLPLFSLKSFIMEIQLQSILKVLIKKRKKVWKLIFE